MNYNSTSASINPEEVEKFSRMAEDWWNPNGKFKPLHKFNPVRLKYIRDKILERFYPNASFLRKQESDSTQIDPSFRWDDAALKPLHGITILDIGCGGGLLSIPLARLGAKVTGIDASDKNINIAKTHAQNNEIEIEYLNISAEELAAQGRQFDVVLNMEVIEHVADVSSFMQASSQLLKDDGLMFVATLNRTAKSYLFAIIGAEYIMRWLPKGTHDWQKFLKPHEINDQFEKNNIKLIESKGVKYNPVQDKFHLDDDLSVNFMMVGKKL